MKENHAESYEGISVNFVAGFTPTFFVYDDEGTQTHKIDISNFTTDGLHELMVQHGFQKKASLFDDDDDDDVKTGL